MNNRNERFQRFCKNFGQWMDRKAAANALALAEHEPSERARQHYADVASLLLSRADEAREAAEVVATEAADAAEVVETVSATGVVRAAHAVGVA